MRKKFKNSSTSGTILLVSFLCLNYPNGTVFSKESFPENNQSLKVGISYLHLRKSFVYLPVAWKSNMMIGCLGYKMTSGKFEHSLEIRYGKGGGIDSDGNRKGKDEGLTLLDFDYNFVWYRLRAEPEQKFFWGLGLSVQNLGLKQKIGVAAGRYNEHKDNYFGFGPLFKAFYEFSQGKVSTGLDLNLTTTLPGASRSIIRTEGIYSNKSYLLWVKLKTGVYCDYRVSKIYTFRFLFERESWIYGRKHQPQYEIRRFFSGGAYLLNSFGLYLGYSF